MEYYGSFSEWASSMSHAVTAALKGVYKVVQCIVLGFASLCRALWRFSVRLVGNYPNIALGAFLVALFLVWMVTFVSMRARAVGAESKLDALSYEYDNYKMCHSIR